MNKPYCKIQKFGFGGYCDVLVWGAGKNEWCKNLNEFTSFIGVAKDENETIKLKQNFCQMISEDTGQLFTIEDLDRIVTKEYYKKGMGALREYTYIVEENIKCFEEGKEPRFLGTSLVGHSIIKILMKNKKDN
jgi:hypothetical protein